MLKLTQLLNRETGTEDPQAETFLRAALKSHPHLTLTDLIRGERDAAGNQRPDGYAGWFWLHGKPSSMDQVTRVAFELKCGPLAPLAALMDIEL